MAWANQTPIKKQSEILKLVAITGKPVVFFKPSAEKPPSAMLYVPYSKSGHPESSVETLFFALDGEAVQKLIKRKLLTLEHEFLDEAHYVITHKGRNATIACFRKKARTPSAAQASMHAETNVIPLAAHAAS